MMAPVSWFVLFGAIFDVSHEDPKKNFVMFHVFGNNVSKQPLLHVLLLRSPSTKLSKTETFFEIPL